MRQLLFLSLFIGLLLYEILFAHLANARTVQPEFNEILLSISINQQELNQVAVFLQDNSGKLWANADDLQKWHIQLPKIKAHSQQQGLYYPLAAYKNLNYRIDYQQMSITLQIPAEYFTAYTASVAGLSLITPMKPNYGGYLNYDVLAQTVDDTSQISSILSPVVFTPYGSAASDFLVEHSTDVKHTVRLNTYWETDDPQHMRSLIVGDSYTTPGSWGKSVGFGGIKWGTNFATQPKFITYPLPTTHGESVVPSVVDLYINNAFADRQSLPAGPFTIDTIPVVTGAGQVSVVTTDLMGRQEVISIPYYASNSILKAGLHDSSYTIGFIRENFAEQNNQYGDFMAVASDRVGLTDRLTGEYHVEFVHDKQTMGVGSSYLISNLGVASTAVAASHSNQGTGELLMLGFQRQAYNSINYGWNAQLTNSNFTQLGVQADQKSPALVEQIFVGIPLQHRDSLGMSYIRQNNRTTDNASLLSCNYNKTLAKEWTVNVSTLMNTIKTDQKAVFLTLTHALDSRTTTNIGFNGETNNNQGSIQLARNLSAENGLGYNLYAAKGEFDDDQSENLQASASWQNDNGIFTAAVAQQQGQTGYQVQAQGGLAVVDQEIYFTRNLGDSFAVVQIPGYAGVGIYKNNQLITHTNANGNALITQLLPYQDNFIQIEPNDLPIAVQVNTLQVDAIPYINSGLALKFPTQSSQGVLVNLRDNNGQNIPAGASVLSSNGNNNFTVADEGEVYLTDLQPGENRFHVKWDNSSCAFKLNYKRTDEPLPDLGEITCDSQESDSAQQEN